ncbi:MAG: hypothetical protein ACJA1A_001861 [Saprospiraceae bacterium]|jgi:hypothetical protein|tara:strand:+ start:374 stop:691 length:318 start_codon:yes stop_codon:yes gene_type:complete
MQIKINSTRTLGTNSINHIELLLEKFQWAILPYSITVNIDSTLKDVDDKLYVQLIAYFEKEKKSFIADATTMTDALKSAMAMLNGKLTPTQVSMKRSRGSINQAA